MILKLNAETKGNVEKTQISARGEYMETVFFLSLDRRRHGELIISLMKDYYKQQRKYPINITTMYGLMVEFEPTKATPVAGGRNEVPNFRNVVANSETIGDGDNVGGGGIGRNMECWNCGGEHMKRDCPRHAEEKQKTKI